jgi:hypothetical protein
MPQLDIYTYFTQFQWFIVIFTLIFIIINGQFIPTFQSLFVIRNFIGTLLDSQKPESQENLSPKSFIDFGTPKLFEFEKSQSNVIKETYSVNLTRWDQAFEERRIEAPKTKKISIKVNESKKQKPASPVAAKKSRTRK